MIVEWRATFYSLFFGSPTMFIDIDVTKIKSSIISFAASHRSTSDGVPLRGIAPRQHNSENASQRWRAFYVTEPDLTGPGTEPMTPRDDSDVFNHYAKRQMHKNFVCVERAKEIRNQQFVWKENIANFATNTSLPNSKHDIKCSKKLNLVGWLINNTIMKVENYCKAFSRLKRENWIKI